MSLYADVRLCIVMVNDLARSVESLCMKKNLEIGFSIYGLLVYSYR